MTLPGVSGGALSLPPSVPRGGGVTANERPVALTLPCSLFSTPTLPCWITNEWSPAPMATPSTRSSMPGAASLARHCERRPGGVTGSGSGSGSQSRNV